MTKDAKTERCQDCDGPDPHAHESECIRSLADRLFCALVTIDRLEARLSAVEDRETP